MANMRVRQAAQYVGLSKSSLDKFRHFGTGPTFIKLGSTVIYRSEDLDAWILSNRHVPANDNSGARAAGIPDSLIEDVLSSKERSSSDMSSTDEDFDVERDVPASIRGAA